MMLRCFGRKRNYYLYMGLFCVSLLALFQSFILDLLRQSIPTSYCNTGICVVGGLSLRHLSAPPSSGGDTSTSTNSSTAHDTEARVDRRSLRLNVSGEVNTTIISNLTSGHHDNVDSIPEKIKSPPGGSNKTQSGADEISASVIKGGKKRGTLVSSAGGAYGGKDDDTAVIPRWQRRLLNNSTRAGPPRHYKYFLVELLQVRIYAHDKAKWSIRELKQWMHFLFLAGVEHIYLCDHYQIRSESIHEPLKKYIDLKLVTYIPWKTIAHPMTAQVECYQYIIDKFGNQTRYQMAIDMDEYPFSPIDLGEGFLPRYLKNISSHGYGHRISEISMNNYLMLGQGDRTKDMVISRINRMTPKPANHLVKPIFKPDRVRAGLHHNYLRRGIAIYANDSQLRMLHYWGARLQDWGPDSSHVINMTVEMNTMREGWSARVKRSLRTFGETDAFSTTSGP